MNPEKVLELYQKYLKDGLDINGVKLIPYKTDAIYTIYYKIDNVNDISYSEMALKGWITESIDKFYSIIGFTKEPIFEIIGKSYYLNDDITSQIDTFLKSVNRVACNNNLYIEVEYKGFTINFLNENSLLIENYVNPLNATIQLTNGKHKKTDLDFAIERYKNSQKLSKYDETEENYLQIDTILEDQDALIDHEWMVEYVVTKFEEF